MCCTRITGRASRAARGLPDQGAQRSPPSTSTPAWYSLRLQPPASPPTTPQADRRSCAPGSRHVLRSRTPTPREPAERKSGNVQHPPWLSEHDVLIAQDARRLPRRGASRRHADQARAGGRRRPACRVKGVAAMWLLVRADSRDRLLGRATGSARTLAACPDTDERGDPWRWTARLAEHSRRAAGAHRGRPRVHRRADHRH